MYQPMPSSMPPAPETGRRLLPGPIEDLDSLCLSIGVYPLSTGAQVIRIIHDGIPRADRDRLRLGFGLEVRAWELWHATLPRLCPDELRALLSREGLWLAGHVPDGLTWDPGPLR